MTLSTAADIVGANSKVALGAAGHRVRRIFLTASGGSARFGDTNVAAAQGVLIPQNVPTTISVSDADPVDAIDLSNAFAYVPSGVTLTVSFGA